LKGTIEEKIDVMGRRGRGRKQLLDELRIKYICWKLEKNLYRTVWRTRFGRGYGPAVRQIGIMMVIIIDATPIIPVPKTE